MTEDTEDPIDTEDAEDKEKTLLDRIIEQARQENPDIRPNAEDDWDWTWADEGFDLLEGGDSLLAERKFQELMLAEPGQPDGYEGLAMVYCELGRKEEALVLIERAVELATDLLARDFIDPQVLDELLEEQALIENS